MSAPWQKPFRGMQINRSHPLSKGLVGAWVLNEKTGDTVFDLSGHGNDGTIVGADWVPDGLGFVASSADYVDATALSNNDITVSVWCKFNSNTVTEQTLISSWDGSKRITISVNPQNPNNEIYIIPATNDYYERFDSLSYEDGLFHNFLFTWNGSDCLFFFDGIHQGSPDLTGNPSDNTQTGLRFGASLRSSTDRYFNGIISKTMIYDRALSPFEVAWLNREPYAMFQQPISPALLYYDAAPPSTAYPVFIHHQNQLRA